MASGKNTYEYKTIKKSFAKITAAISPVLGSTAIELVSVDLINNTQKEKAANAMIDAGDRASELTSLILNKVEQDSNNFHKFVEVLKGDLESFRTVLNHMGLSADGPSITSENGARSMAKQSASASTKEFSGDLSPADLVAWLSQEFQANGLSWDPSFGQKLIDEEINGEAFMDLEDKDLADIGFKKGQRMKILKIVQSVKEGKDESSPGQSATKAPSKNEKALEAATAASGTHDDLSNIDNTMFDQDNWNVVYMECSSLAPKWKQIGIRIGLPESTIEDIGTNHHSNGDCWQAALSQWIKQNYPISDIFQEPSWKSLLKAVKEVDKGLYNKLALKHGKDM